MKRLVGFSSRIAFLLCLIAFIFADSSILSNAANSAPEAIDRDKALTGTKSTRGSAKATKQLIARTKASSSTVPAGEAQSTRRAARSDDYRKEIADLRARLDRQEQLLAAQQQQIEKLAATVAELRGPSNRSLLLADASGVGGYEHPVLSLASHNPAPAPKLEEQAAISHPQIPAAAVKSQDPLASAASITPKASELFPLADSTGAPPLTPSTVAGLAPVAPAIQTSVPSNSTANQNVTQPTAQDQTRPYVTRLDTSRGRWRESPKGLPVSGSAATFVFAVTASSVLRTKSQGQNRTSGAATGHA